MDEQNLSDDEVVASVLAGRRQDFEILVRRYSARIVHFIARMTSDGDEARSIAQEVFLKIYQNLPFYRAENNFSAFIFRVARNLTLNWIKSQKRIVFFSRLLGRDLAQVDVRREPAPPGAEERQQRDEAVTGSLRLLPEEQRLALVLKVYLEFSYRQIKEITGWSVPKIETLISRARSRLKREILLQESGGESVLEAREK